MNRIRLITGGCVAFTILWWSAVTDVALGKEWEIPNATLDPMPSILFLAGGAVLPAVLGTVIGMAFPFWRRLVHISSRLPASLTLWLSVSVILAGFSLLPALRPPWYHHMFPPIPLSILQTGIISGLLFFPFVPVDGRRHNQHEERVQPDGSRDFRREAGSVDAPNGPVTPGVR